MHFLCANSVTCFHVLVYCTYLYVFVYDCFHICMIVGWAVRICACTLRAVCAFCLWAAVQVILYVYEYHTKKACFKILFLTKGGRQTDSTTDRDIERVREKKIFAESREMLWSNFAAGVSATQTSTQTHFQIESSKFHSLMTLSITCKPHKGCGVMWHLSATVLITTWNDCISRMQNKKSGNRPLGNKEFLPSSYTSHWHASRHIKYWLKKEFIEIMNL